MTEMLTINVLGYVEDGDWVAHALEMDIVAVGDTFEEACEELNELIDMQLSFAALKQDPSLVSHPAPIEYWNILNDLKRQRLDALIAGKQSRERDDYRLGGLPWPQAVVPGDFAAAV